MSDLLVMKFGGRAWGLRREFAWRRRSRGAACEAARGYGRVGDVEGTDLCSIRYARRGGDQNDLDENLKQLYTRHFDVCRELLPRRGGKRRWRGCTR